MLKCRMSEGRRKPGVVCYRGRIYVVGGMSKTKTKRKDLATVEVLNPITEQWETGNKIVPPMKEICGKSFEITLKSKQSFHGKIHYETQKLKCYVKTQENSNFGVVVN